jgi:hypothetical protein
VPAPQQRREPSFRISFSPSGIEVTGKLTSAEQADELIRAIELLKTLLPPASDDPSGPSAHNKPDQGETAASVPFMITKAQRAQLQERGYTTEQIREMKPEDAHRLLGLINGKPGGDPMHRKVTV